MQPLVFSTLKPSLDIAALHQANAVRSWRALGFDVVLFGTETGTGELAAATGAHHIPDVDRSAAGTPLLSSMFERIRRDFPGRPGYVYCNGDIILTPGFRSTLEEIAAARDRFLMIGRRWNLDVGEAVDFTRSDWAERLDQAVERSAVLGGIGALDYFAFSWRAFPDMPPMAVGRAGWDNWMVGQALESGVPVLNATSTAMVVHQNHDYGHIQGGRWQVFFGAEARNNRDLRQGVKAGNCADAVAWPSRADGGPSLSLVMPRALVDPETWGFWFQQGVELLVPEETDAVRSWNRGLASARGYAVAVVDAGQEVDLPALASLARWFAGMEGACEWLLASGMQGGSLRDATELDPILVGREGIGGMHPWLPDEGLDLVRPGGVIFSADWLRRCGPFREDLPSRLSLLERVLCCCAKGGVGRATPVATHHVIAPGFAGEWRPMLNEAYFSYSFLSGWLRALESEIESSSPFGPGTSSPVPLRGGVRGNAV